MTYNNNKSIFEYNYSTYLCFKCTINKYAELFKEGKIKFSQPKIWIEQELIGNKGQGDQLEGVLFATKNKIKYDSKSMECFKKNNLFYYRRKSIKELYSFCLYVLNSNMFKYKTMDRFGRTHEQTKVSKKYFAAFSDITIKDDYYKVDIKERPNIIFINNVHLFLERIKKYFINIGILEKDILILPVNYVDLDKSFFSNISFPNELFFKNNEFSYQSEIRVVINSLDKNFIEHMKMNNGVIDVGDLSDIVDIHDYYFEELLFDKCDNELLYNLPNPKIVLLDSYSFSQLLNLYSNLLNNRLPYETTKEERMYMMTGIEETIKEKYDIFISSIDNTIYISNVKCSYEELFNLT